MWYVAIICYVAVEHYLPVGDWDLRNGRRNCMTRYRWKKRRKSLKKRDIRWISSGWNPVGRVRLTLVRLNGTKGVFRMRKHSSDECGRKGYASICGQIRTCLPLREFMRICIHIAVRIQCGVELYLIGEWNRHDVFGRTSWKRSILPLGSVDIK